MDLDRQVSGAGPEICILDMPPPLWSLRTEASSTFQLYSHGFSSLQRPLGVLGPLSPTPHNHVSQVHGSRDGALGPAAQHRPH